MRSSSFLLALAGATLVCLDDVSTRTSAFVDVRAPTFVARGGNIASLGWPGRTSIDTCRFYEGNCHGRHRKKYACGERFLLASMESEPGTAVDLGHSSAGDDSGMDPFDLNQAMGSMAPDWGNETIEANPRTQLIKGSIIDAKSTAFRYSINSFPPLISSEVYYNGTADRYWWNQNSDTVCVYVPVARDFNSSTVDLVVKTTHVSLRLGREEILAGTPFYRVHAYESLYVLDMANDPPYLQIELYKVREYQNWEDLLLEGSSFERLGSG